MKIIATVDSVKGIGREDAIIWLSFPWYQGNDDFTSSLSLVIQVKLDKGEEVVVGDQYMIPIERVEEREETPT